jgi:hypothetical protein
MVNTRFSVSTDPEIHAAIKAHADAAGLDVSGYLMAAAVVQMAADDAAAAVFAPLDADNAAAQREAAALEAVELPSLDDLTAQEQDLVRRVLGAALGVDRADVA